MNATRIGATQELGLLVRAARKSQGVTQLDVAGLGNTENWIIVDIENGKPTVQLKKVLDLMDLLGTTACCHPESQSDVMGSRVSEPSVFDGERLAGTIHDAEPLQTFRLAW